jgi:oligopeptide transport system substrate-binding protein
MNTQGHVDSSISPIRKKDNSRCFRFKIVSQFPGPLECSTLTSYISSFEEIVESLIPASTCFEDEKDFLGWIQQSLPQVKWVLPDSSPGVISLILLCRASKLYKTETFLLQLLKNRLIPHKEASILSFHHLYFHFDNLTDESLLCVHVQVLVEDSTQLSLFQSGLPLLIKEIAQVAKTPQFAKYFLETKNLSEDFKAHLIFQDLIWVLQKFPNQFDQTILSEFRRFLALASKDFLERRSSRHLFKILMAHHVTRKIIARASVLFPDERQVQLRLAQTKLQFLFGTKSVVGLMIGVCLLDRYEFFEEKHILLAVQKIIPGAQLVKGSFYVYQSAHDMIRTLYLEIEKKDAESITLHERGMLKMLLPNELKGSVEKLTPAVFMMRNEEEIMKNILIISQELKYFSDLPQVMISLEQQAGNDLLFTILLVRLLRKNSKPLHLLFQNTQDKAEFIPDRVQIVGYLRKKYPKEANAFRLRIQKEPSLLRTDSSVNFYLARRKVMEVIEEAVGEVRDYNGGMILQQVEQFTQLKQAFPETALRYPDLLEDFFYSLTPIEMQAALPLEHLHSLFRLLLEALQGDLSKRESYVLKVEQKAENIFVMMRARESSYRDSVQRSLQVLEILPKSLCSTHVDVQGSYCTGYIYDCASLEEQHKFLSAIQRGIRAWQQKLASEQVLRLSFLFLPISMDPRLGGDENSERLLELLFEGLMRMGSDGKPTCGIAKTYEVSSDLKCYTFKLRESFWNNGDRILAYDFEYAWKKILSPDFSTSFAYFFYPIKNAKFAKEGKITLDEVGVKALDERTLRVELENPSPSFLELTAYTLFSPVNHRVDRIHPNWAEQEGKNYVCNGPFFLMKANQARGYELVKNPHYWNERRVSLDRIFVTHNNSYTELQMFKNDEIDWLGRPLSPWDPSFVNSCVEKVESCPTPRIFWYVFNVKRFPFTHPKLRKAFAYALDKRARVEELRYDGSPAATPLPIQHTLLKGQKSVEKDKDQALLLFDQALFELGIKKEDFPVITLMHTTGGIRGKTSELIRKQWEETFDIRCRIESHEWTIIFERMTQGDYQVSAMNWRSSTSDPIYTLNAFRYASEKVNFAKWEDVEYQKLLDAADKEVDFQKRQQFMRAAEEILCEEMPVIPIYNEVQQFKRKSRLQVAVNPHTGHVDFSNAFILQT